jgi:hypothetical protein
MGSFVHSGMSILYLQHGEPGSLSGEWASRLPMLCSIGNSDRNYHAKAGAVADSDFRLVRSRATIRNEVARDLIRSNVGKARMGGWPQRAMSLVVKWQPGGLTMITETMGRAVTLELESSLIARKCRCRDPIGAAPPPLPHDRHRPDMPPGLRPQQVRRILMTKLTCHNLAERRREGREWGRLLGGVKSEFWMMVED